MKEIHRSILPVDLEHKENLRQVKCYQGCEQKTYETQIGDVSGGCPPSYECIYNPGSKMINIDDVLRSLNNAVKD